MTLVQRTTWDMWPRERDNFRGRHTTSFWWRGAILNIYEHHKSNLHVCFLLHKSLQIVYMLLQITCSTLHIGASYFNCHPYKCTTYEVIIMYMDLLRKVLLTTYSTEVFLFNTTHITHSIVYTPWVLHTGTISTLNVCLY